MKFMFDTLITIKFIATKLASGATLIDKIRWLESFYMLQLPTSGPVSNMLRMYGTQIFMSPAKY